jgi:Domain of unknown function (DUF4111)
MPAPELRGYLARLSERVAAVLDGDLLGLYAGGSVALGAYEHGPSDVDVVVVCRGALGVERKRALVEELRHEALPCPARGLELVVYAERTVGEPSAGPGFELELTSGAGMPFHAAFDPSAANGRHRYVLDRAILARHGLTLLGPPPSALVADVPRELVLPALAASLRWSAASEAKDGTAVLSACCALRYASEGRWSSQAEAGRWALEHLDECQLITDALAARETGAPLACARTKPFLERAADHLHRISPSPRFA